MSDRCILVLARDPAIRRFAIQHLSTEVAHLLRLEICQGAEVYHQDEAAVAAAPRT